MPLAVCATPIGNLADVTLRVLEELGAADLVLCEDTRHTRILLERHGIAARLSSYHRHNEAARTAGVLERLRAGERVALVSDAGLPGINDPGARLIVVWLAVVDEPFLLLCTATPTDAMRRGPAGSSRASAGWTALARAESVKRSPVEH